MPLRAFTIFLLAAWPGMQLCDETSTLLEGKAADRAQETLELAAQRLFSDDVRLWPQYRAWHVHSIRLAGRHSIWGEYKRRIRSLNVVPDIVAYKSLDTYAYLLPASLRALL
ncbi:hypothetical protein BDR06DRAFT_687611 [Suillus hirtellus]|nr:hypothetical protein BDR06DRAFT_687611 [Suillus hirtellus]